MCRPRLCRLGRANALMKRSAKQAGARQNAGSCLQHSWEQHGSEPRLMPQRRGDGEPEQAALTQSSQLSPAFGLRAQELLTRHQSDRATMSDGPGPVRSEPANPPACVSYLCIRRRFGSGKLVNQTKGMHADKSDGNARRQVSRGPHTRTNLAHHHQAGVTEGCSPRSQPGRSGTPRDVSEQRPPLPASLERAPKPSAIRLETRAVATSPNTCVVNSALLSGSNPPSPLGNNLITRQACRVHTKLFWVTIPKEQKVNWQGSEAEPP